MNGASPFVENAENGETRAKSLDVVTFGETMGLFFPQGSRGLGDGGLLMQSFGGAESNAAIGLARLGRRAGWFSRLGDDPIGRRILRELRGEGVDVSRVKLTDAAPTGLMLRETVRGRLSVYYYRKYSAASTMTPDDLDPDYIGRAKILHITGITPALSASCRETVREAVRIARRAGVKISFDPNLRLKLWTLDEARPVLMELAAAADYFLPGYDELKLLYDTDDPAEIRARIRELSAITVVKNANGANWLYDGNDFREFPFEPVRIVDPVGAGDGFAAGFLAGVLNGGPLDKAVELAAIAGALAVQAEGDWESLPHLREVEQALGRTRHIER
ncbi:MAG TPA: sugar kinase [Paenibacillaceae bacterium]